MSETTNDRRERLVAGYMNGPMACNREQASHMADEAIAFHDRVHPPSSPPPAEAGEVSIDALARQCRLDIETEHDVILDPDLAAVVQSQVAALLRARTAELATVRARAEKAEAEVARLAEQINIHRVFLDRMGRADIRVSEKEKLTYNGKALVAIRLEVTNTIAALAALAALPPGGGA